MKCLIVVNESPWQSGLAVCALRFAQAAESSGLHVTAVFFREDGVYHALAATSADAGTPDLTASWQQFAESSGARLLLCSASSQRRLPEGCAAQQFRQTGLAEMLELMQQSDKLVTF